jgi:hypothetical protein
VKNPRDHYQSGHSNGKNESQWFLKPGFFYRSSLFGWLTFSKIAILSQKEKPEGFSSTFQATGPSPVFALGTLWLAMALGILHYRSE